MQEGRDQERSRGGASSLWEMVRAYVCMSVGSKFSVVRHVIGRETIITQYDNCFAGACKVHIVPTTFAKRSTRKWSGHGLTSLTGSYGPERWEEGEKREGEGQMFTYNYFVGHLKGTELLKRYYEGASTKANQSRTPLHPVQQKSTAINSTPANITIINRTSLHSSQSPQPSPTCGDVTITEGNSTTPLYTAAAVTMTTQVTTKRRLKLEEGSSCKPQTKRTKKSGCSLKKDNSGQRTMQSYFQPA